jgi:hypothetical protein
VILTLYSHICVVLGSNLGRDTGCLTQVLHGFHQPLRANDGIVPLGHYLIFPNPVQFIILVLCEHSSVVLTKLKSIHQIERNNFSLLGFPPYDVM